MYKTKALKIALISLAFSVPQLSFANGIVSSTIKTPDPYSGNQSWFRYYQTPGSIVKDSLILRNLGNQTIKVKLYPTDATANQAGSFSLKTQEENQKGIGKWTKMSKSEVTLDPNQTEEVPFEISIPKEISPGQYFGGLVNEESTDAPCGTYQEVSGSCQGNIQIKTRSGNRVYLTIPGEINQNIKLTKSNWTQHDKAIHFNFTFVNKGNIAFEPKANISIYNMFNQKITSIERSLGKSLPGTTISPITDWLYENNYGPVTAKIQIIYNQDNLGQLDILHGTQLSDNHIISLYVIPWGALSILVTLIASIWWIIFLRKKYFEYIQVNSISYEVKNDENIMDIAEKTNTNWQTIVRLNNLKAPYILTPGRTIKIIKKNSVKKHQ